MNFEFVTNREELDERSIFANAVCKLIVTKNDGSLIASIREVESVYNMFSIHVRNIYELVDTEIPLFALYELNKHGSDNFMLTQEEFIQAKHNAVNACAEYYDIK